MRGIPELPGYRIGSSLARVCLQSAVTPWGFVTKEQAFITREIHLLNMSLMDEPCEGLSLRKVNYNSMTTACSKQTD